MQNRCGIDYTPVSSNKQGLIPVNSGEEKCSPNHCWGAGVRANYLIHYVISGTGVFYCGPNKITVKKGQIFVIFPNTIAKYQADSKNPWHYTWVEFGGDEVKDVFSKLGITILNPVFTCNNGNDIVETIRLMPTQRSANMYENLKYTSLLYEFMSLLIKNVDDEGKSENVYLKTATRYIKAHYTEDITVDKIASYIGISRKYLFAIFKNLLKISPKDYIINYRIEKACEFLKDANISIGNVAYSVGYKDPLTFSKMFKLKTGVSPTEYRNKK